MAKLSDENRRILARAALFSGLDEAALSKLVSQASVVAKPNRATLFLQGDPVDCFYLILEGWVKLSRLTPGGEQAVIAVFGPGETFGEVAMLSAKEFRATAEVVAPARLMVFPAKQFMATLWDNGDLALNMLASISRHVQYLNQRLEHLQAKTASQRVGDFLLPLIREPNGSAIIRLPYDKSLIAARLGMKPETFSRALAKLRQIGVRAEGDAVVVHKPTELLRYCEG